MKVEKITVSVITFIVMVLIITLGPIGFEKLFYLISNAFLSNFNVVLKRPIYSADFFGSLKLWFFGIFLIFLSIMFVGLLIWITCLLDLLRLWLISVYNYFYGIIEELLNKGEDYETTHKTRHN